MATGSYMTPIYSRSQMDLQKTSQEIDTSAKIYFSMLIGPSDPPRCHLRHLTVVQDHIHFKAFVSLQSMHQSRQNPKNMLGGVLEHDTRMVDLRERPFCLRH
ncbi:hypothetical protein TNCV_455381 [Trichonephila clavipes]|nr:hypothetical protein TNCV_455381 [Trichonephila clavipes]